MYIFIVRDDLTNEFSILNRLSPLIGNSYNDYALAFESTSS